MAKKEQKTKETKQETEPEKTQDERINELSTKIFGKPAKDIKYLLVTNYIHTQLLDEELTRTGLYQWINVFRGEVKYPREVEDYSEYDIVQVNMSAQDLHLVNEIRDILGDNSKTKLVLNNDYTTEMWGKAFEYLPAFERGTRGADMLFGTEYFQVTALAELTHRKVFVIPHPADVKRLKSLTPLPKKNKISVIWRRYDNNYYIPALVARNHGLTTQLIGYDKNVDPKPHLATTMYDYVLAGTNYFEFCDQLRESKIIYDPFTFHSYSRTTVDTAALGVPVVGSNRTQSMNTCYPYTAVDPWDVNKARILIERLLTNEDFYKKVVETAYNNVENYNHKNSLERYLMSLDEALETDKAKFERKKKVLEAPRGDDVLKLMANDKTRKKTNQITK